MPVSNRRAVAVLAVGTLLVLAGCMDATITTEVTEDGDIAEMEIELETLSAFHTAMEQDADEEGYDSLEAMLEDDFMNDVEDDAVDSVDVEIEDLGDDGHLFVITATDVDPDGMDNVDISVEDDTVRYEYTDTPGNESVFGGDGFWDLGLGEDDEMLSDLDQDERMAVELLSEYDMDDDDFWGDDMEILLEALDELFNFEYVVEMPGEIEDSNADEVDGTTATWTYDLMELDIDDDTYFVESGTDGGYSPMPGLGVATAIVALVVVLGGAAVHSRR